jgi:hypothetical protein
MSELLFQYYFVDPRTWVYLSSLLMIGLFFKFSRFWSVRNLDLVMLILLAPGLLMVYFGERMMDSAARQSESSAVDVSVDGPETNGDQQRVARPTADVLASDVLASASTPAPDGGIESGVDPVETAKADLKRATDITFAGYVWLLCSSGLFLLRLLLDPMMVRRPLLEPNLSTGGLAFIGCALFVFLMANVVNGPPTNADLEGARGAEQLLSRVADQPHDDLARHGPGNALLHSIPALVTNPMHWRETSQATEIRYVRIAKLMALLSNFAILLGIVLIGYRHFGSTKMGLGAASLYLMLPYNNLMAGYVDHVLPAALLVWAVLCYRQPWWAGMFIGTSIGVVYYPLFLLPLWISFYWERGLMRFLSGVIAMLLLSVGSLVFVSADTADFLLKVRDLFGIWMPRVQGLEGVWGLGWDTAYRYPVLAAFIAISGAFALWPAQKNLGTLLSCSAAVMVATQFWHGHGGGLFMAWFLPLTLLTIFRPNLEDRVALSVLGEGWFPRRRKLRLANVDQAA